MHIRFSAGTEVLRVADILASEEAMAPMSVEGALLAFDFADRGLASSVEAIHQMDAFLGEKLLEIDGDANLAALTALKRVVVGLETDVSREFALIDARKSTEVHAE